MITTSKLIKAVDYKLIQEFVSTWDEDYLKLENFLTQQFEINCSSDQDIIKSYTKDWSNIPGNADFLVRPKSKEESSILLAMCYKAKIQITISAGKTNLTGSATPKGGIVLSTDLLTNPKIKIDIKKEEVTSPIGISLEILRKKVMDLSKRELYYPVDPTSRHDAYVGGTLACNASGFVPGETGATRYWVNAIELLLPNGELIEAKRNQYFSKNGFFHIQCSNQSIKVPIPKYKRPQIKNASGPSSSPNGVIDFVDFIIGSEGIFGMIVSCKLGLKKMPKEYLELFICLDSESKAIALHDYFYDLFKGDMSKITALEYFGYNSQTYMKHKEFLFKKDTDVGIYLQIPIYNNTLESKSLEWINLFNKFDRNINTDNIIVLNDPLNWKKFFEARHSIPDNALTKTKQLGGISIITDTIVPPGNFSHYLKKVHAKLQSNNIEYLLFGHLGDCHLHFHLIPNDKQENKCLEIYDYLIDLSAQLGGVYSAEHGTGKRKRNDFRKCYGDEAVKMVRQSKLAIDPKLILNRGNVFKD